ncbi:MAG: lytic transglycosylase domain-containing protein [Thermoanaerobaculaceae bacterium]
MRLEVAFVGALIAGTTASASNVFLVMNPDGTAKIINIPVPSLAFRLPNGGGKRSLFYPIVESLAKDHGLDPRLVDMVIRLESGYNPVAVSQKGAKGVMQLMPQTAALYGVNDLFDVEQNLRGGMRYLRDLLERFNFDLAKALAAYNAGPGAVERHGGVPPYAETQRYVSEILAAYRGDTQPSLQGGFGRKAQEKPRAPRPVTLQMNFGRALVSNAAARGEAAIERRLTLK